MISWASGDINDYQKDITILKNTVMIVRKDNEKFGEIPIKVSEQPSTRPKRLSTNVTPDKIEYFSVDLNGKPVLIPEGSTYDIIKGDVIKVVDVFPRSIGNCVVNFKGFVGDRVNNTGEDRGYDIDTGEDLMERYATDNLGDTYQIVVTKAEKEIGSLNIRLILPKMDYLVLKIADGRYLLVRPDESITLSARDNILLEAIATNILDNDGVHLEIGGNRIKAGESRIIGELCRSGHNEVNIKKGDIHLAKIFVDLVM